MSVRNPRETIDLYYKHANEGKWTEWCDLFADNMVMDEQLAGHIEGLDKLRPMMSGMSRAYSRFKNVPKNILQSGDEASVVSHISAANAAGVPIEAEVMNFFRFCDGKIAYMANYHDSKPFIPFLTQKLDGDSAAPSKFPIIRRFMGRFLQLPQDHVNAYIVELSDSVVIIDSTLAISSSKALRAQAESTGKPIRAVLLTHGHPDHFTGLAAFPDVPRIASHGCLAFARQEDYVKAPTAIQYFGDDYPKERLFPNELISDGAVYEFDGVKFTFTDLGPAESPSDGMWVVEKDGVKHAFVGDVVALNCHCFFRDLHTLQWIKVLERLKSEFDDSARFYMGHGEAPVGKEAIEWQLGYNKAFLNAVASLEDRSLPVDRARQEKVIAAMKTYLPNDATLFLLDYEMGYTIESHFIMVPPLPKGARAS